MKNPSSLSRLNDNSLSPIQKRSGWAGIYIHFPFCIQKCSYCDFFSIGIGKKHHLSEKHIFQSYKKELDSRLASNPKWIAYQYDTIFFGGGTPSRIEPEILYDWLLYIKKRLNISPNFELTLEANPEDVTLSNVNAWKEMGFNRINMGYQTSTPEHLATVGRYYDAEQYASAPEILANSSLQDYGYDLIYGFPNQTMDEFFNDLDNLYTFKPSHLSMYSLTMEKGTEYSRMVKEGKRKKPQEELQIDILNYLPEYMRQKGMEWYEVSNYCLPGHRSKHNLRYWTMEPYMAIGPGAHGFDGNKRYNNPRNLEVYNQNPTQSHCEDSDYLPELFLSLFRIFAPIDIGSFLVDLNFEKKNQILSLLNQWQDQGFAIFENGIFQWKDKSVLNLDSFILEISSLKGL
jgi:putative oxygen-independent coproporphyrinogen III oxidase